MLTSFHVWEPSAIQRRFTYQDDSRYWPEVGDRFRPKVFLSLRRLLDNCYVPRYSKTPLTTRA